MSNPIFDSRSDGQQAGVSPANPINDPNFNSRQGSNTFDLSYQNLLTARFGEITPFFYMSSIGRDRIELRSSQDLRTYTLGAPLMSQVRMKKSYFSVPLKCIMPNTWDYLFVNPVKGNDVPADAYCYLDILSLGKKICSLVSSSDDSYFSALRGFLLFYHIFSRGSLLDYLGISLCQYTDVLSLGGALSSFTAPDTSVEINTLDQAFDMMVNSMLREKVDWSISLQYTLSDPTSGETNEVTLICDNSSSKSDLRNWFYMLVQHPESDISETNGNALTAFVDGAKYICNAFSSYWSSPSFSSVKCEVNLYKLISYQLISSQFYSNDHVDSLYNSDLWFSNMRSLLFRFSGESVSNSFWSFSYNGVPVYYDIFSNHVLSWFSSYFSISSNSPCLFFFYNLFTFRRSLRFGDYFNSSRPRPLAVGDVSVPVVGNNVNVIDVNKNLHVQRFLNAVNRVGSNILDYAKGIFGYTPQAVDPRPSFISSEYVVLGTDEIDNTAESQGTVNTNLVSQNSQYAFDVTISDPCIILGLCSFEVLGAYPYTIERDNFHKDRYDMFNPFLQHIGDQEVKRAELGQPVSDNLPFGYQVRYAEYKFKYPQQHGGFNDISLKLWSMPYKMNDLVLSEDFIRDYPAEFDKFYKSLQFSSLANYFHFQISFMNSVRANRAMDFQPTLLG